MSTTDTRPGWADSKESWLGRVHDAELPSGIKVTYRDLSTAEFAFVEELPTELLELAVAEWAAPGTAAAYAAEPMREIRDRSKPATKKQEAAAQAETEKRFKALTQLNRELIALALVEPRLTADELRGIPLPDLEMLSLLVNRQLAVDAAGRHVGVVPIDQFRHLLQAHGVECPPDCETCETERWNVSTLRRTR